MNHVFDKGKEHGYSYHGVAYTASRNHNRTIFEEMTSWTKYMKSKYFLLS